MPKKISKDDAKRLLCDCRPETSFWVNNGPVIKNLNELPVALKSMNDDQFSHHISHDKNDFARWVDEVIGDHELSQTLAKAKSKTAAIKKINDRLEVLKKTAS